MTYKIAAVTEGGEKLSSHFGMAKFYRVFTVNNDRILGEEIREKPHHERHPDHHNHGHHDHGRQGNLHDDMFAPISDCEVLIAGGMGDPAYRRAQEAGLKVVLIGGDARAAVQAYLSNELASDARRVHRH